MVGGRITAVYVIEKAGGGAEESTRGGGATERGFLRLLVSDSLVMDVVEDVQCSVLLAEKARERSLRERLFGSPSAKDDQSAPALSIR